MPGDGGRETAPAAVSSSHEEAADNGKSPVAVSLPHVLFRRLSGAQAKPDNVADDCGPQGCPEKLEGDADRRPQGVKFVFLPHMMVGRRVPSLGPKTPPPPEVQQLPTAFMPIPRCFPPGPRLPDEMTIPTIVLNRGEDTDNQNPSAESGSQRNPRQEQRDGVSMEEGYAIFPINKTNPCSPERDRRNKVNNGGVGYQKRTTGDIGTGVGRLCNRSKENDSPADIGCFQERRAVRNQHYEHLQKRNSQECQRQATKTQPTVRRNPLLGLIAKQKAEEQWFTVSKHEKHNLKAGKQNSSKVRDDDLLLNGVSVNDVNQDSGCLKEQTEKHADGNEITPTLDIMPYADDLTSDVVKGHSSKTEHGNEEEMEDFVFKIGTFTKEDLLDKFLADSLKVKDKSSCFKHAGVDSVGKDLVSSSSKRIFERSVNCRSDIENSTPHFLSVYRSLVLLVEEEKYKQKQLLCSLTQLVKEEWPSAQLHLFGSCANSFVLPSSDVDVCLSIDDTNTNKQYILLKLAEILLSKNFLSVKYLHPSSDASNFSFWILLANCVSEAIANARIPIVKMIDPETDISCDICINNLLAVANTKLLRDYARIDDRVHQLAFIVKRWAKLRGVNDAYQGTLSSYAYVLMCIHFLQLRKPAILPCLQVKDLNPPLGPSHKRRTLCYTRQVSVKT